MKKVKTIIAIMLIMSIFFGIVGCNNINIRANFETALEKALGRDVDLAEKLWVSPSVVTYNPSGLTTGPLMLELSHDCDYSSGGRVGSNVYEEFFFFELKDAEDAQAMFEDESWELEQYYGKPSIEYQEEKYGYVFYIIDARQYFRSRFSICSECQEEHETRFDLDNTFVYEGYYYYGSDMLYFYRFSDKDFKTEEIITILNELGLPHSIPLI